MLPQILRRTGVGRVVGDTGSADPLAQVFSAGRLEGRRWMLCKSANGAHFPLLNPSQLESLSREPRRKPSGLIPRSILGECESS